MSDPPVTNLSDKFDALSAQLAAQHAALLAALADLAGGATLGQVVTAIGAGTVVPDANTAAILAAIGSLAGDSDSRTVRDLLAQIDIDIAGDPVIDESTLNADPGTCSLVDPYESRVEGFTLIGTFSQNGATYDAYAPNAPTYPILGPSGYPYIAGGDGDVYLADPNASVSVCLSWDWTGMAIPPASFQLIGTDALVEVWPSELIVVNERSFTGAYPRMLFQGETVGYRFVVPAGDPAPALNVFWHASLIPFGS